MNEFSVGQFETKLVFYLQLTEKHNILTLSRKYFMYLKSKIYFPIPTVRNKAEVKVCGNCKKNIMAIGISQGVRGGN